MDLHVHPVPLILLFPGVEIDFVTMRRSLENTVTNVVDVWITVINTVTTAIDATLLELQIAFHATVRRIQARQILMPVSEPIRIFIKRHWRQKKAT